MTVDVLMALGVSAESGSWFESGGSKSGSMMCASCKTFRCASGAASGESPPFMFRPVKDEDATAVSAVVLTLCSLLTARHLSCITRPPNLKSGKY